MRTRWIDNAKGIAILLVIIGHVSGNLTGLWNFAFVYGIHLVTFFLISGYNTKQNSLTKEYVQQKFQRLMLPYFYTCVAIMITDIINSYIINKDGHISTITYIIGKDLLRSFFASGSITSFGSIEIGTRIGAIWFLPAIFFATLIFQFLLNRTKNSSELGVCCAFIALAGHISARFVWLPFSIQSGMLAVFFLWIGYEARKRKLLEQLKWYHFGIAQVILLLGIYKGYCSISFATANFSDPILSLITGLAGSVLIYLISRYAKSSVLSYIGKHSLIIMCTHLYALETMEPYLFAYVNRHIVRILGLSKNGEVWSWIIIEILFAVVLATIIEKTQNIRQKALKKIQVAIALKTEARERDRSVDIMKGILIILMLVGHFSIDSSLRSIIYSCHMVAFVVLSGYFYRKSNNLTKKIWKLIKAFLLPYGIFVILNILLNYNSWSIDYVFENLEKYILGISFANHLFSKASSVGPVYFILLLFVVRVLYIVVDYLFKTDLHKIIAVLCISLFGTFLGNRGYWLPWSFDVACYCLIFYQIGISFRKYHVFETIRHHSFLYFVLSPIWVYMIYSGSMEIALRNYGAYGLVVLGATAGTLLIYQLSQHLLKHTALLGECLRRVGEGTIFVLIVHTLLSGKISVFLSQYMGQDGTKYMICSIMIQLFIALIAKEVTAFLRRLSSKFEIIGGI